MSAQRLGRAPSAADLHFHLLPGVDDGPETLPESLDLARRAVAQGTGTIVATPHVKAEFLSGVSELEARVAELRAALRAEGIDLVLHCGAELGHRMVGGLGQRELDSVAQGPPGARWVLLEAPFEGMDDQFHDAAAELRERGFGVLLAHPERSADAELDGSAGLRRELERGALAQVNAQSLTGDHGSASRSAAFDLIRRGMAAVIASDAHGPTRPPSLVAARERLLAGGVDADTARTLTLSGPRQLLARGIAAPQRLAA